MLVVVTGVSFLIHVYATGYMRGDPGYGRFFAYMNLFVFSMLVLVLAGNFLLLMVGWGGVGLCSYLLISFWFQVPANAAAGVPLCSFGGVVLADGRPTEAVTCWLETGRCWWTRVGQPSAYRTSGRVELAGASVDLMRPKANTVAAWQRVADRAGRVTVLGSTCVEAALVAEGSIDAFADPGSDTHRIVDLAAALVTVPAAGGVVLDVHGRPLEFDFDLTRRWSGVVAATRSLGEQLVASILR